MGHQEFKTKLGPASIIPAFFDIGSTAFLQVIIKIGIKIRGHSLLIKLLKRAEVFMK